MKFACILRRLGIGLLVIAILGISVLAFGCTTTLAPTTPGLTPTGSGTSTDTPTNFIDAVQSVLPSVVEIEVTYGPQGAPGNPKATGAAGTGWVIRADGLIVTNNHVVESAKTVTVILMDGTRYDATSVQTSPSQDLAVVKIGAQNLPAVVTGDSAQVKVGQPVAAIGNALNLGIRVTVGVISQLNVPVSYNNVSLKGLFETDAAINPGNSGGVLIDINGKVVGIPNAGLEDPNLDVENFGYAITIDEAMPVISQLMTQIP